MIEIREAQLDALADARAASLPGRIEQYLHEIAGKKASALRPGALHRLVVAAIERAGALGFDIEWDACRFALLTLELGAEFEQQDWALPILADEGLSATLRMDELEHVWLNYLRSGE